MNHTPGPWNWYHRGPAGNVIELIHPRAGQLLVMDFVRLGMQRGTFRLATWEGEERGRMGGIMRPAHEIDLASHPDAQLIAAAPDLLSASEQTLAILEMMPKPQLGDWNWPQIADTLRAAIAKAKGGAT